MIEKFEFLGEDEGVSLLVFGSVHGNEVAGKFALERLISEINDGKIVIKKGKLVVVPVCNKEASIKDVRQIDENLNRVMKMGIKNLFFGTAVVVASAAVASITTY